MAIWSKIGAISWKTEEQHRHEATSGDDPTTPDSKPSSQTFLKSHQHKQHTTISFLIPSAPQTIVTMASTLTGSLLCQRIQLSKT
jgi:hypothetical protein